MAQTRARRAARRRARISTPSFRGRASSWREPGIHPAAIVAAPWIPGSRYRAALCADPVARPGMTKERDQRQPANPGMTAEVFVLREILAAERLIERARFARYGGDTGPARRRGDALGVDERA
jgi:hypothetical protein